jgi:hypothetical protein
VVFPVRTLAQLPRLRSAAGLGLIDEARTSARTVIDSVTRSVWRGDRIDRTWSDAVRHRMARTAAVWFNVIPHGLDEWREGLTTMPQSLIIAPDVIRELGGQAAAHAMFADSEGPFHCAVCGYPGEFGKDRPASVVVVVVGDGGQQVREVKLAHPHCSPSKIRMVRAVPGTNRFSALPGAAWLRPADTDPAAVLVIGRNAPESSGDANARLVAPFISRLVDHGFAMLSDPDTPLPHVHGLTAWHTPGRLAIYDRYGESVWDGRLPSSHAWTYAAVRSRRLGVVVASGVQLAGTDQARSLYGAITGGRAAGAAIPVANPTPMTSRRWPYQIRPYVAATAAGAA